VDATAAGTDIFIADSGCGTIREVSGTGTNRAVTAIAGLPNYPGNADGTGSAARFSHPYAIAVDSAGAVYISDIYCQTIRKGVVAPPLQILSATLNFSGGQFGFHLSGPSGQSVVVQASSNLLNWSPVWTNVPGLSPLTFSDLQSTGYANRFYRAVSQ
jgi:hypothetical protein